VVGISAVGISLLIGVTLGLLRILRNSLTLFEAPFTPLFPANQSLFAHPNTLSEIHSRLLVQCNLPG
jgi:hypothetical protein